ncbi:MAG: hypothetical protein WAZ21_02765 [Candidatus Saccharimonadales bacterium]
MSETHTVTINGRKYDAVTGLALDGFVKSTPAPVALAQKSAATASQRIHHATQRSQTLNRKTIQKPIAKAHPVSHKRAPQQIPRSQAISKFAPHPVAKKQPRMSDIAPSAHHPAIIKAQTARTVVAPQQPVQAPTPRPASQPIQKSHQPAPSQVIKNEAIAAALEKAPLKHKETKKKSLLARHPRLLNVASASLALVLLGGYLTYVNLPSLSVRVAAAQAGINASYPEYHPDGYSLNGAVAYKEGEVSMKFAANGGPQNFTITQSKSSYDSEAVLDNYVKPKVGENYIPFTERGLKIFAYGGNAAWVNGGILYTIDGDAPLSNSQIGNIAKSL